jgi:transmembrane sensor
VSSASDPVDHLAIEERAAAWLARRDGGDWSSEDDVHLTAWLSEATAHRVAFLRLESAWEGARRARALGRRQSPYFQATEPVTQTAPQPDRLLWWPVAAACFAVAVGLGTAGYIFNWLGAGSVYSTPVGGIRSIPLADGSMVTLNTASRIRVELEPKERRVVLESGEAFFAVKRNPARPFIVIAGEQKIIDVGTQFSVRRDPTETQVVVTEGAVRFESSPTRPPLTAGSIAFARDGDVLVHKESVRQAEDMVSWRKGYLTFRDTSLADAVAEFNRYNVRRIDIADSGVAGIRISGTFRPTNYEAFVRLLHDGYAIDVQDTGGAITLSKQ